ncbi:hypothetical protein V2J09_023306 [Rumex salicifolius]
MACIKSVNRSASVALSPDAPYLAAGTMAGAVDLSFSTSAHIEIFKLDFQSDEPELPLLGQSTSSERFNRLSWGKSGSNSEEFNLGLIAGGLIDGKIGIWNPNAIIGPESSADPLVAQLARHNGPVRGLEFNSFTPHMLASGADDGEICIWDLANPAEPTHFPPLRGNGSAAQGEISYLSWNSKVQHILASASYNGTVVVWDLKKQKPVISGMTLSDVVLDEVEPNRRRCSVFQWNPDLATQLVIASDDDDSPTLRLWDMRNTMSPVKEFVGHSKGVISMSWCPIDSSYLLTCAKDNRTLCWDTLSGEIVCELPEGTNWNFDVHWYQKIPGVISASSFDGKIGLYNIEACDRYAIGEANFAAGPLRAPKWYKRSAGVCFGFGGKLLSFHSKSPPTSVQGGPGVSEIYLHNVVMDDSLVSRSTEFQAAIQNGERASLRTVCEKKEQESESEDDKETWGFLKVMFEDDGTARSKLLTHLGFSAPDEGKGDVQEDVVQQVNDLTVQENVDETASYPKDRENAAFSFDNGEDFFNNLSSPKADDTPVSSSVNHFASEETVLTEDHVQGESYVQEESTDPAFDEAVQRALVVGDYKGAVAQCLSANRIADALVIAHVGGPSLWESTRDQYLKKNNAPYLKVVSAMVNRDLTAVVNTRPLKYWKETLALVCTFAQGEEWTSLCGTLASKLMASGYTLASTLCYICAGNIDKTVEIWSSSLSGDSEGKSYADSLQDLMEKTIMFVLATGQKQLSSALCKLFEKYSEILASQGLLSTAMDYLKLLGEDLSPELLILRDRIAFSTESVEEEAPAVHTGTVNAANQTNYLMTEDSQHHYQNIAQPQPQPLQAQPIPPSSYSENYQQYPRSYNSATPYQPTQQQHMFFPSQTPQVSQHNFAPPAGVSQPAVKSFMPATPSVLKNADQYQQPTTLASHLYPGAGSAYLPGSSMTSSPGLMAPSAVPLQGPRMPSPMGPVSVPGGPTGRGFMPVAGPGMGAIRPGASPAQPSSPTVRPAQPAVVPPSAPPPTVQTADTSKVPAEQRPIVGTLTRLFHETVAQFGGAPARKKEMEDNSRRIGSLFDNLNKGQISNNVAQKLLHLCDCLDKGDYNGALQCQVQLTTSDWDECQYWLAALKRMIRMKLKA